MGLYKLKHYYRKGSRKGEFFYEEHFYTREEAEKRYNEVFVYEDYSLNPTMWELKENGEWIRIEGF